LAVIGEEATLEDVPSDERVKTLTGEQFRAYDWNCMMHQRSVR